MLADVRQCLAVHLTPARDVITHRDTSLTPGALLACAALSAGLQPHRMGCMGLVASLCTDLLAVVLQCLCRLESQAQAQEEDRQGLGRGTPGLHCPQGLRQSRAPLWNSHWRAGLALALGPAPALAGQPTLCWAGAVVPVPHFQAQAAGPQSLACLLWTIQGSEDSLCALPRLGQESFPRGRAL